MSVSQDCHLLRVLSLESPHPLECWVPDLRKAGVTRKQVCPSPLSFLLLPQLRLSGSRLSGTEVEL